MTNRRSLRAWLAVLLVASSALFFVGISLERGVTGPSVPVAVQPSPSGHVEGEGGEAGEVGHSEASAVPAGETGESPAEHAGETWPLGIDLEAPILVGGAIVVSLLLALAVLRGTSAIAPVAIVGFLGLFGILDLLEVSHQLGASRVGLAAIAALVLVLHVVAGVVAIRLAMSRPATAAGR